MDTSNNFRESLQKMRALTDEDRDWASKDVAARLRDLPTYRGLLGMLETDMKREMTARGMPDVPAFLPWCLPKVFISHAHKDKQFVRNLARQLSANQIDVWLDEWELDFGDSLIERLREAINAVDILLAVISPSSVDSEWVKREVDVAMNQEIEGNTIKVIPILRAECDPPGFLKGKLYADFTSQYRRKKNFPKLVKSIHSQSKYNLRDKRESSNA